MKVVHNGMGHPVLGDGQSMIKKLREAHAKMEALMPDTNDEPYAILVNQENFEKLLQETQHTKPDLKSNEVMVPVLYGVPVILQNVYPYKVVTQNEYRDVCMRNRLNDMAKKLYQGKIRIPVMIQP